VNASPLRARAATFAPETANGKSVLVYGGNDKGPEAQSRAGAYYASLRSTFLAPLRIRSLCPVKSRAGDVVADLFAGSGSTLIACERQNRKSRLMEIDPRYADCIIQRFQEYSGKNATLDGDGRTFAEITAERRKVAA